jgi:hypothetical protein
MGVRIALLGIERACPPSSKLASAVICQTTERQDSDRTGELKICGKIYRTMLCYRYQNCDIIEKTCLQERECIERVARCVVKYVQRGFKSTDIRNIRACTSKRR